jgi:hypothetical protein
MKSSFVRALLFAWPLACWGCGPATGNRATAVPWEATPHQCAPDSPINADRHAVIGAGPAPYESNGLMYQWGAPATETPMGPVPRTRHGAHGGGPPPPAPAPAGPGPTYPRCNPP